MTFGVLLLMVMIIFNSIIIIRGGGIEQNIPSALILMFSPAILALLVNYSYERNLQGFSWTLKNPPLLLLSYLVPLFYIAIAYGLVIVSGNAGLDNPKISGLNIMDYFQIAVIGVLTMCLQVMGEEIGWRGFLLNNLHKKLTFTQSSLIVGVVWALFHYPLLFTGAYEDHGTPLWYRTICFTIAIMGANMAINWLHLKSGSLWAALIFHAAHNSLLSDANALIINTGITGYLLYETGIVLAGVIAVIGLFFWLKRDALPQPIGSSHS